MLLLFLTFSTRGTERFFFEFNLAKTRSISRILGNHLKRFIKMTCENHTSINRDILIDIFN